MIPILLAFGDITHFGGGGNSLIKVGTDMWRVQNLGLGRHQKTLCLGKKSAQKPNDETSFHDFVGVPNLKENCNAKTSCFQLKGRSESCKMRPKSLKSAKPFSRYSTLKI